MPLFKSWVWKTFYDWRYLWYRSQDTQLYPWYNLSNFWKPFSLYIHISINRKIPGRNSQNVNYGYLCVVGVWVYFIFPFVLNLFPKLYEFKLEKGFTTNTEKSSSDFSLISKIKSRFSSRADRVLFNLAAHSPGSSLPTPLLRPCLPTYLVTLLNYCWVSKWPVLSEGPLPWRISVLSAQDTFSACHICVRLKAAQLSSLLESLLWWRPPSELPHPPFRPGCLFP